MHKLKQLRNCISWFRWLLISQFKKHQVPLFWRKTCEHRTIRITGVTGVCTTRWWWSRKTAVSLVVKLKFILLKLLRRSHSRSQLRRRRRSRCRRRPRRRNNFEFLAYQIINYRISSPVYETYFKCYQFHSTSKKQRSMRTVKTKMSKLKRLLTQRTCTTQLQDYNLK